MFNKNEIKKELLKRKAMANFSFYKNEKGVGNLYYTVQLESGLYQFPIATTEIKLVESFHEEGTSEDPQLFLSSDLGETPFTNTERGSMLNRWIDKAIDKEEFIKVG